MRSLIDIMKRSPLTVQSERYGDSFFAAQYTDSLRSKKSTSHDALRIVLVDFFCKDIKIDIHISP